MPNHKSSEKRVRQSERRRLINRSSRATLRTSVKKLRTALAGSDQKEINAVLPATISQIDKAVQKGVLHRNAAARRKSRLMSRLHQLSSAAAPAVQTETKAAKAPARRASSKAAADKPAARKTASTATRKPAASRSKA